MTRTRPPKAGRRALLVLAAVALMATSLVAGASPASAHTRAEAIRFGCGTDYRYVEHANIYEEDPRYLGEVILARVPNTQRFCVVTRKGVGAPNHGTPTYMEACIRRQPDGWTCDEGNYLHFANRTGYPGQNLCIRYYGYIQENLFEWGAASGTFANGSSCT